MLVLNESKTEIIMFGLKPHDDHVFDLGHCSKYITSFAKNLGVIFDSGLLFEKQVNAVVKSSQIKVSFFNTFYRLFIYLFVLVLITVMPYITVLASLV